MFIIVIIIAIFYRREIVRRYFAIGCLTLDVLHLAIFIVDRSHTLGLLVGLVLSHC